MKFVVGDLLVRNDEPGDEYDDSFTGVISRVVEVPVGPLSYGWDVLVESTTGEHMEFYVHSSCFNKLLSDSEFDSVLLAEV